MDGHEGHETGIDRLDLIGHPVTALFARLCLSHGLALGSQDDDGACAAAALAAAQLGARQMRMLAQVFQESPVVGDAGVGGGERDALAVHGKRQWQRGGHVWWDRVPVERADMAGRHGLRS